MLTVENSNLARYKRESPGTPNIKRQSSVASEHHSSLLILHI